MGKNYRFLTISLLFCLLISLVLVGNVDAKIEDDIKPYGGISLNTYNLKDINEFAADHGSQKFNKGLGYYGGINYWINSKTAFGGEIDYLSANWKTVVGKIDTRSIGVLGKIKYKLPIEKINLYGYGAFGLYNSQIKSTVKNMDTGNKNGFGFKLGLKGNYSLTEKAKIFARAGYRKNNVKIEETNLNLNGFESAVGIQFNY